MGSTSSKKKEFNSWFTTALSDANDKLIASVGPAKKYFSDKVWDKATKAIEGRKPSQGTTVKSREALLSDIRSGKVDVPRVRGPVQGVRSPYRTYVPSVGSTSIDSAEGDVNNWVNLRKAEQQRGGWTAEVALPARGTNPGGSTRYLDLSMRIADAIARRNAIAKKTYDVLASTGVYSKKTLDWARKGRFNEDGVAGDRLTKEGREVLYMEGLRGLRGKYTSLSGQKELYGQKLKEAQDNYTKMGGYKGFDDFVARNAGKFSSSKEWDAYDEGVQRKIWAAQARNNPSEVARLVQVANGRRVQMQEMAQKKAMSAWSGSGASNLWRAQKELEDTLANQQVTAIRGMNAAMKSNAVLAKQLGVSAQSLLDKDNGSGDTRPFAEQLREAEAARQMQQPQPQQPGAPVANGAPSGGQAEENQTAVVRRKPREVESYG